LQSEKGASAKIQEAVPTPPEPADGSARDPLFVRSVEKAFRVLHAFSPEHQTMSLSQIAAATRLDMSAAQRFAHTLMKLGYLKRDSRTKRFELTTRTLDLGYSFIRASSLIDRTVPYILHLSKTTEETVSLTVLDGTEIVYIARFVSHNMLNTDVIVGTRLPAYCTAPGIAILSRLEPAEAHAVLARSQLRSYTPQTTWRLPDLQKKIQSARDRGYASACEEIYLDDLSFASAIIGSNGQPEAALTIATSKTRYEPHAAEEKFAPLVMVAARSLSRAHPLQTQ
jgi:DNA-binding IclR family transcriptional regulator